MHKKCTQCKKEKDLSLFGSCRLQRNGLRPECKQCRSATAKAYYLKNKAVFSARSKKYRINLGEEFLVRQRLSQSRFRKKSGKEYSRNLWLKTNFGIDSIEYNKMLEGQNQKCGICGTHKDKLSKNLCIDHNHSTGFIRGLLCHSCNLAIGNFKDNIDTLLSAIHYLRRSEGSKNEQIN